jgi:Tol biopolymer transport system component
MRGPVTSAANGFPIDASQAHQLTSGSMKFDGYYGLSWTPDGRLIFTSTASGNRAIWIMHAEGTGQKQLTSGPSTGAYPSMAADGRYIVFTSDRVGGNPHVWRMDSNGNDPKQLTNGSGEISIALTPDGRWVLYADVSLTGRIFKVSIDGGESTPLTDNLHAGRRFAADVSPDGKFIVCFYRAEPNTAFKIAIIPIEGGTPLKLLELPPTAVPIGVRWTLDGRAVTYVDTRNGVSNLWGQPLDGGPPVQLTNFTSDLIYWFDFSHDGRWLALTRGNSITDVVLFRNLE